LRIQEINPQRAAAPWLYAASRSSADIGSTGVQHRHHTAARRRRLWLSVGQAQHSITRSTRIAEARTVLHAFEGAWRDHLARSGGDAQAALVQVRQRKLHAAKRVRQRNLPLNEQVVAVALEHRVRLLSLLGLAARLRRCGDEQRRLRRGAQPSVLTMHP